MPFNFQSIYFHYKWLVVKMPFWIDEEVFASGKVCIANARNQPEIDMPDASRTQNWQTRGLFHWSCVFFDLQEEETRRQDQMYDTMFTIQLEFLAVSTNAKSRLLTFVRRKKSKI